MRVVPNKYPALVPGSVPALAPARGAEPAEDLLRSLPGRGHHEVIVEGPVHRLEAAPEAPDVLRDVFLAAREREVGTADAAVQCFGGFGYSILSPVTKHLLDTRVARIYEGTDEIMELKVASTVLGREFEAYK